MKECPDIVGQAKVVMFTPIDDRHAFTGACKQIVADKVMGPMAGLAICQYKGETAYYLFGCDQDWNTVTDTWHQSLEEAIKQAEFEYTGTSRTWQRK
jgi:hypothetical protein